MKLCGQRALSHHLAGPGPRAQLSRRVVAVRAAEGQAAQGGRQQGWRQRVGTLGEAQLQDVLVKLAKGGFVDALEDNVLDLDAADMQQLGIEPMAVRKVLLRAFAQAKRELSKTMKKTIKLEGADGEVLKYELDRDGFRGLTSSYGLVFQVSEDAVRRSVSAWEELEDGGVYRTDQSLRSQVQAQERFQKNVAAALEEEAREKGLAIMQEQHSTAQPVCRKTLKNKQGHAREFDALIEADSCVLVMETKLTIDMDAVKQLSSAIEFVKQGAADGAVDLDFAKGKEIKGALAGMRMAPGPQSDVVKEFAKQEGWELLLLNGKRFSSGSACHKYQSPRRP